MAAIRALVVVAVVAVAWLQLVRGSGDVKEFSLCASSVRNAPATRVWDLNRGLPQRFASKPLALRGDATEDAAALEVCLPLNLAAFQRAEGDPSFFFKVRVEYAFVPDKPSHDPHDDREYEWRFELTYAKEPLELHPVLQWHKFEHDRAGDFVINAMARDPFPGDGYFGFLHFSCDASPTACTRLAGVLSVNYTVTPRHDKCGVHAAGDCDQCLNATGCGWCSEKSEFTGCWAGDASGPEYDAATACGRVMQRSEQALAKRWKWSGDPAAKCPRKVKDGAFKAVTFIVVALFGVVLLMVVVHHVCKAADSGPSRSEYERVDNMLLDMDSYDDDTDRFIDSEYDDELDDPF